MAPTISADRHADRVAIVTGGASGIGRATVVRLVAEGASVVACDVNADGLDETRAASSRPDAVVIARADVTDSADVDRVIATCVDAFGRVDALANVAGIMDNMLPPHELDDATWDRVMKVNVDGPMRLSRAVLRRFLEQQHGVIVNVASEAGVRGGAAGFAYTTSKHAVIGQTRSIAWLYAPFGIRCNAVLPGGVATNIGSTMDAPSAWALERLGSVLSSMPSFAEPDQIAALISWLASDEASNVNGALVTSDGGWAAG
jgi:NAD(P)-dependent dehydrogenase (short-subunit alcohol dehydrogenase family)